MALLLLEILFRILPTSDSPKLQDVNQIYPKSHYIKNNYFNFSVGSFFQIKAEKKTNNYGYFNEKNYIKNSQPILVIGDSYVVGMQVDNDKVFHNILNEKLKDQSVYSIGVISDSLPQYLFNTLWALDDFEPKILIYSIANNDYQNSFKEYGMFPGKHYFNYENQNSDLQLINYKTSRLKKIMRSSALIRYLIINIRVHVLYHNLLKILPIKKKYNLLYGQEMIFSEKFKKNKIISDGKLAIDIFLSELDKIFILKKIPIIIIVDAIRPQIYESENLKNTASYILNNYMIKKSLESQFIVINLNKIFTDNYKKNRKKFEFKIDMHWNDFANQIVADELIKLDIFKNFN